MSVQTTQYCKRCAALGHACEAQGLDANDEPICVFCEDGQPCPVQKRAGLKQTTSVEVTPAAESPEQEEEVGGNEDEVRKCQGEGCEAAIGAKCRTGLCTRCYAKQQYRKTHPDKGHNKPGRKPKAAEPAPVVEATIPAVTRHTGAVLMVNENQLNDFIVRLPLSDKERMVNNWLAGN